MLRSQLRGREEHWGKLRVCRLLQMSKGLHLKDTGGARGASRQAPQGRVSAAVGCPAPPPSAAMGSQTSCVPPSATHRAGLYLWSGRCHGAGPGVRHGGGVEGSRQRTVQRFSCEEGNRQRTTQSVRNIELSINLNENE